MSVQIITGDCLHVLRDLPACSVDSVVTDPPYGLSFMGKKWDYDVPSVDVWAECLRVLKPGGHLLAFAGTRTQHRMAVRIEDAGFEIRDMIAWVYGSGFPKSLDVSRAVDTHVQFGGSSQRQQRQRDMGEDYAPHPLAGTPGFGDGNLRKGADGNTQGRKAPVATDAARQWEGWGTALKPALEPITMARKPLAGTVAANVVERGVGAINVDGCRVATNGEKIAPRGSMDAGTDIHEGWARPWMADSDKSRARLDKAIEKAEALGRWPANLIHDGSEEVLSAFPDAKGQQGFVGQKHGARPSVNTYGDYGARTDTPPRGDSGSAARFFYCAKASKADRGEGNDHPTVKPTDLMRYLCRLVTPPGGVVLDPFMGSGSTGKAAVIEGFRFVGIERDPAFVEIARARIVCPPVNQPDLFGLPADAPAP